jgi:hypothetical protein
LRPYAIGDLEVGELLDATLITQVEALRGILELAYRQRITFDGEERKRTGTAIDAEIVAGSVDGELAVVDRLHWAAESKPSATWATWDQVAK